MKKFNHSKYYRGLGYSLNIYKKTRRQDDIGLIVNWGLFFCFVAIITGFFAGALN